MKRKRFTYCVALLLLLNGCKKIDHIIEQEIIRQPSAAQRLASFSFTPYLIPEDAHYALNNTYMPVETTELKFAVMFDSSAIYTSRQAVNQHDINKLYGFADNNKDHHQYSARFGWNWINKALHLYAYIYNEGKVQSKELTTIAIGEETECSIKISGTEYLFRVNEQLTRMPRKSTTPSAQGYLLYPYFGGDETAPHPISILIKNL